MGADLRPYIGQYVNIGQLTMSQNAPDQWYNCTLECLRRTTADLGFGSLYDDEQMRNDIRARFGSTGLNWDASIAVAHDLIPGLEQYMSMQLRPTDDVVAATRAAVSKGYIVHIGLWCDTNAWVPAIGPVTYSHACRVVADLDNAFVLQNPEPHPDFALFDAQLASLWDAGGILVFTKSVLPAKPLALHTGEFTPMSFAVFPDVAQDRIDMFYVGTDHAVYHKITMDGGATWSQFVGLGGRVEAVAAAWKPSGDFVHIFGLTDKGEIWEKALNAQGAVAGDWWKVTGKDEQVYLPKPAPGAKGDPGAPGAKGDPGQAGQVDAAMVANLTEAEAKKVLSVLVAALPK